MNNELEKQHNERPRDKRLIVQASDENFNFRDYYFEDTQVVGLQVAREIGVHPVEEYVILQWLKTHELETIRLGEMLKPQNPARVFIIKGDVLYRFNVDGLSFEWPLTQISVKSILYLLENNDPCVRLSLERTNAPDQILAETDIVVLADQGVEKLRLVRAISIIVNGRAREVFSSQVSFCDIIKLAFEVPPTGVNTMFTVTFRNGPQSNPEGSMTMGSSVKIQTGMIFNVTATNKS